MFLLSTRSVGDTNSAIEQIDAACGQKEHGTFDLELFASHRQKEPGTLQTVEQNEHVLVIGSGLAGLAFALKVADRRHVTVVSKRTLNDTNTRWAQGGVAAVQSQEDSFDKHIEDTLIAGAGLCRHDIVKAVVETGPERIDELRKWGVDFDSDLTREGGHSQRRILHVADHTGQAIHSQLLRVAKNHPNIEFLENHFAIDLLTTRKLDPSSVEPNRCLGAYVLDIESDRVLTLLAQQTVLATGGAGKVYLYTSNWEGATGDGIALAARAGARVANLEFMQFHPTCLYHPLERTFLISEALRGEGAELVDRSGQPFMQKYHKLGALAPRDIVARSIDAEMKSSGAECVYLDIRHKPKDFLTSHFPVIYEKCLRLGIDISRDLIPVVPAAHYLCGGVLTNHSGETDIEGLFAIGETACTGLHGANRLASNSLLECLAFAHWASERALENFPQTSQKFPAPRVPDWVPATKTDPDEMVVISHMWEEIRRLMWNYVGIVRSNKRLERAEHRLDNLTKEVRDYYVNLKLHPDILELRNIALVASLTVQCARKRRESRGIHYNIDFPNELSEAKDSVI